MKWTPILFFMAGAWIQGAFQDRETPAPASNPAPNPAPKPAAAPNKTARPVLRIGPPDVQRGDKVAVRVMSGSILLTFEAEAVSSARVGESVIVLNPVSGRRFVARVEEKGKVLVKK